MRIITAIFALVVSPAFGQDEKKEEKPQQPQEKKEVIITASPLHSRDLFDTQWSADVLFGADIQNRGVYRTLPESLKEVPGVSVQKTSNGHGSPFIRGFTGFRNVLLVDGIRVNNSVFREGPNQYWNTVDSFLIDRLELIRGPASVLYGSDAIGGTVAAYTKEPEFGTEYNIHAREFYRFASAERSHTSRTETWGAVGDFGWFGGVTYRDLNDVDAGRHTGEQPGTGYDEYDADLKGIYRLSEKAKLILAFQHTRQDDVRRVHRDTIAKTWHGTRAGTDRSTFFDQERNLVYVQLHATFEDSWIDALKASVSWSRVAEEFNRTTNETNATRPRREVRDMEVDTPAFWVQAGKNTDAGYFTGGIELYHDRVSSDGHDWLVNGTFRPLNRGEVADDATYTLFGIYVQDEITIGDFDFTPGIRFSYAKLDADEVDPDIADGPIVNSVSDTYTAVTGSFRALYHLNENWNIIAGWGMGFRAPTLDDTTGVRLVQSGNLDLPAEGLDPESTHTFDLGVRAQYEKWQASAFVFYTIIDDFIRRVPSGTDFNGDGTPDQTKDNFADGWVWGFEIAASYRFSESFLVWADWSYVKGEADALVGNVEDERPLDKVNPMIGHLGVRWEKKDWGIWLEAVATMVRHQHHLSPGDDGDTQRIPPGGTPGFGLLTIRGGYTFCDNAMLTLSVENLTNKDYRWHGSGQNEPGTNAIVGIDVHF
jgi:hemoglobin/transferrin/lactoferrin receptor protein